MKEETDRIEGRNGQFCNNSWKFQYSILNSRDRKNRKYIRKQGTLKHNKLTRSNRHIQNIML